jgi:GTPase
MDKLSQEALEELVEHWHVLFPKALILPISALCKINLDLLLDKIVSLLPLNPPFYPKDQLSDKSERFFVNEIIRERILTFYKKEIPYSVEVVTQSFKEEEKKIFIEVIIYVERETQKGILIGHKGLALCNLGKKSREKLKKIFKKEIYLHLKIEVKKNWRSNKEELKKWGYIS